MATHVSPSLPLFDWATKAKAHAEKTLADVSSLRSTIASELYEAEKSEAPKWRLKRLRKELAELEKACDLAKKARHQFN